ncbi:MAG: hypothetical protein HN413_09990 [Chloroflexi bacterium]|nr:hypothetical protein [Chloroflexota bacterium]
MDKTNAILKLARDIATAWDWTAEFEQPATNRLDIYLPSVEQVVNVAAGFVVKQLGYLTAITGLSCAHENQAPEALYHFCRDNAIITLRAQISPPLNGLPSLGQMIPNAKNLERHLHQMCAASAENPWRYYFPIDEFHLELKTENEKITAFTLAADAAPVANPSLDWQQTLAILTQIYQASPQAHRLAYCLGLEQLAEVDAPPRAQALRLVLAELERIAETIQMLGEIEKTAGFAPLAVTQPEGAAPFLHWINQMGSTQAIIPGGVIAELSVSQADDILAALHTLDTQLRRALDQITNDSQYQQRLQGKNKRSARQTDLMGVTGPLARAAGVPRDLRGDAPYAGYLNYSANLVLESTGDLFAGLMVQLVELGESIQLIRQVLHNLPAGSLAAQMPATIPAGEAISRVEAPQGELFYFLKSDGSATPQKVSVYTPTACNFNSVLKFAVDAPLSDLPLVMSGCLPASILKNLSLHIQSLANDHDEITRWEQLLAYCSPDVV